MVRTMSAADRTAARTAAVAALREEANDCISAAFEGTPADLDDRYTVARFVDAVEDLVRGDDEGVDLVESGRYAPEGTVGNYPPLWAEVHVSGAVYLDADALNSDAVDIHLLEQWDGRTLLRLRPAVEFDGYDDE